MNSKQSRSRCECDNDDEDVDLTINVKRLCLNNEASRGKMQFTAVHKRLPCIESNGEPTGDTDYEHIINPILKELAILRNFRRAQLMGIFSTARLPT